MEGVVLKSSTFTPDAVQVRDFLEKLTSFANNNGIELYLISGYHKNAAEKKFTDNKFGEYFDKKHFIFVDDEYISNKAEMDKKLHTDSLIKDPEFNDTYFKQVIIQRILKEKDLNERDALLLSDDIWVDGYYTTRFSKIDFALFELNLLDRGKPANRLSGLAYFNLDFDSVKTLLENFPKTSNIFLEKYVFEEMKKVLVGDDVKDSIKRNVLKKLEKK
jgi:hypothetical protein